MDSHHRLIAERQKTHGDFAANAQLAQLIKTSMRVTPKWEQLSHRQREALELIATKIGRILSGDPNHADSWRDIGGYAALGVAIEGEAQG